MANRFYVPVIQPVSRELLLEARGQLYLRTCSVIGMLCKILNYDFSDGNTECWLLSKSEQLYSLGSVFELPS